MNAGGNKKARMDASEVPKDGGTTYLGLAGFIAPACVQFLGVRSLCRFSASCMKNKAVVEKEVERRKDCVAVIENKVMQLLGTKRSGKKMEQINPECVISRADFLEAKKLVNTAKNLIDDEINFIHKLGTKELRLDNDYYDEDECNWKEFDLFLDERKNFLEDYNGSLYLLPDCFYIPPEGEASTPSKEELDKASKKAGWLWGAEDMMGSVCEFGMDDPNWERLDYENPFRKFNLLGAGHFTYECMEDTAHELAGNETIDAFPIAARKVFFFATASRDCLWYTLEKADEFAAMGGNKVKFY